jgi:hypothetical protein
MKEHSVSWLWLQRLEFEAKRQKSEIGRFEMRHAQLVEIVRIGRKFPGLFSFEESSKAQLMLKQLARWLAAYASFRHDPDACRPRFPLTDIDDFTFGLVQRLLELGVSPPNACGREIMLAGVRGNKRR